MQRKSLFIVGIVVVLILAGAGLYFGVFAEKTTTTVPDMTAIEVLIEAGDYSTAQTQLEALLTKDADDAEAHFQLGLVLFNLSDFAQAKEHFQKALELDPSRAPSVHHNMGVLAFRIGDLATAQQEFEAALELDPSDPDTHYQLGATYLVLAFPQGSIEPDVAKVEIALAEFNAALDLEPGKPEPLVGIGNIYMLQNQLDLGIEALNQALEKAPDMREALFALGKAYMMTGDFDLAKTTLEHFMETDPPKQWADQAQEMLDQIG